MARFAAVVCMGLVAFAEGAAMVDGKCELDMDMEEESAMLEIKKYNSTIDEHRKELVDENGNPSWCSEFIKGVCPYISGPCQETIQTCKAIMPNGAAACKQALPNGQKYKDCVGVLPAFESACMSVLKIPGAMFSESSCKMKMVSECR